MNVGRLFADHTLLPSPHPERAMAAALLPLCPHVPLVKAMCTKLGKEKYVFALVFHTNARQLMSTLQLFLVLFSALVSSHVCYVALLPPPPPPRGASNNGDGGNEATATELHPLTDRVCSPNVVC